MDDNNEPRPVDGCWRRERLDGDIDRNWYDLARRWSEHEGDRARMTEAIADVTWQRLDSAFPFHAGGAIRQILDTHPDPKPIAAGYSTMPIDLPEAHLVDADREHLHPDLFMAASVVGLRALAAGVVWSVYYLDIGDAIPLAFDMQPPSRARSRTTKACAAHLHDLCQGAIPGAGLGRRRCACHCQCAARHPGNR